MLHDEINADAESEAMQARSLGPEPITLELFVNGRSCTVKADPATTLVEV